MPLQRGPNAQETWRTPAHLRDHVHHRFGRPPLDAATTDANWMDAEAILTPEVDALSVPWGGVDWLWINPPYNRHFYAKIAREAEFGTAMIALVPSRPGTRWFQSIVEHASLVAFWRGRLKFEGATQPAPFESALIYTGGDLDTFIGAFDDHAWIVDGGAP